MSNSVQLNHLLDEQSRQAYLNALDIVQWEPLNSEQTISWQGGQVAIDTNDILPASTNNAKNDESTDLIRSENHIDTLPIESEQVSVNQHNRSPNEYQESATLAMTQPPPKQSNHRPIQPTSSNANHYLKIVNWSNTVLSEENSKTLMVICRHQVDQPANSFARINSPSQFMMDYINTLTNYCTQINIEVKVQLAHLSAAGLSDDCVELPKAMQSSQSVAALLLGDETVAHLLGDSMSVASARGQMHRLSDGSKALVSYHPYSLIQNPLLKRLALEDLMLATELLTKEL